MRRLAGLTVAAAALAVAGLPGCGAKTNEATRAAGIVPGNAVAFLSASLDPSIAQKRNLLSIANRFPKARDKIAKDFEQTRDNFIASVLKQACLDYQKDVKPWLGSEVAVAVLPKPDGPGTVPVLLMRVKDEAKARATLSYGSPPGNCSPQANRPRTYKFADGFAVVVPSGDTTALDAVGPAGGTGKSLAKQVDFTRLVDELHGDRLLVGYSDAKGELDAGRGRLTSNGCDLLRAAGVSGKAAFDVHAEPAAVVVEGVADQSQSPLKAGAPTLTESLPTSTTGAFTVFDIAGLVRSALACTGTKADVTGQLADQTGLDLDADVLSWMGGEAVLVTGPFHRGRNLPDFGLVVHATEPTAAAAAVSKLTAKLTEDGQKLTQFDVPGSSTKGTTIATPSADGTQPAVVLVGDRLVLATTPDFAGQLAQPAQPGLGQAGFYKSAVGRGTGGTQLQLVVDVRSIKDGIVSTLPAADRNQYQKNVAPQLDPVQALGLRLYQQAGLAHIQLKVALG